MLDKLLVSLEIMGKGMAGIFAVIIIIMALVMLLSKMDKK